MRKLKYNLGEIKAACSKLNINFAEFWLYLGNDSEELTYQDYDVMYPFEVNFGDKDEQLHPDEQLS